MKTISFMITCYKSENTIGQVIDEIKKTVDANENYDYEVVAVNDASPDNVWKVLLDIAKNDPKVKLVNLVKNTNKSGAEMAGLSNVTGDYVVMMDDDGQCPMDRLWDLVKPLEEGHDISVAKYPQYKQSKYKDLGTYINRKMTEIVIDKPKDLTFTNFVIMKKYVVDEIIKYKNPYSYIEGLMLRSTSDIVNVEMEERERIKGKSNFTFRKMVSLWVNGFTSFSIKPLRLSTIFGTLFAFIGFVYGLYIVIYKLILGNEIPEGYSSSMAVMLFIGGMIMLMLGIIGEYIGRIYMCINSEPQYIIKEKVNIESKDV